MGTSLDWVTNWQLWFWIAIFLFVYCVFLTIILIIWSKKTHALVEFKAWRKGIPISMFFQDSGYCEWRAVKTEAGIIQDDDFGTYLINEKGTYIDRRTKNILIPFDANLATSINVSAAKLADDLKYILRDEKQMALLRQSIMLGQVEESETVDVIRASVQFSAIKGMLNAMIPHAISAKIEKMIALRMKGYSKVNVPQIILIFVAILGAIILGTIIVYLVLGPHAAPAAPVAAAAVSTAGNVVNTIPLPATSTPAPVATTTSSGVINV